LKLQAFLGVFADRGSLLAASADFCHRFINGMSGFVALDSIAEFKALAGEALLVIVMGRSGGGVLVIGLEGS